MNILLACLIGLSGTATEEKTYFPYGQHLRWMYQNDEGVTAQLSTGQAVEMDLGGKKVKAIRLTWWKGERMHLVQGKDGIKIYKETILGRGGRRSNRVWIDLRWGQDTSWTVLRRSGCRGWKVNFERKGFEEVKTSLGVHRALKITTDTETYWLAPGVGIVKYKQGERTWTIQSFGKKNHIHKCGLGKIDCWLCGL